MLLFCRTVLLFPVFSRIFGYSLLTHGRPPGAQVCTCLWRKCLMKVFFFVCGFFFCFFFYMKEDLAVSWLVAVYLFPKKYGKDPVYLQAIGTISSALSLKLLLKRKRNIFLCMHFSCFLVFHVITGHRRDFTDPT